jgi:hypothetical protein
MTNGSAYGKRLGGSAAVRRHPPRPSFLDLAFAAHRQCTLFFVGVAVRVAVQSNGFFKALRGFGDSSDQRDGHVTGQGGRSSHYV